MAQCVTIYHIIGIKKRTKFLGFVLSTNYVSKKKSKFIKNCRTP